MINFLTSHIITSIGKESKKVYDDYKYQGFIWFDEPIVDGPHIFDRLNLQSPFRKDEIMPTSWYAIKPRVILEILNRVKNNEIYLKALVDGYIRAGKPTRRNARQRL